MENIRVKLAQAHQMQNRDFDVKKELRSVQEYIDELHFEMRPASIHLVLLKGFYDDFTKRMTTAMVFINNTGKAIRELHGVVRLKTPNPMIKIAKTTINFDEPFMGIVDDHEAILVHFNIPVKGLEEKREFTGKDFSGEFSEVKVTYVEE